jgi:hypothetical protein
MYYADGPDFRSAPHSNPCNGLCRPEARIVGGGVIAGEVERWQDEEWPTAANTVGAKIGLTRRTKQLQRKRGR